MGIEGLANLVKFVRDGGTLITEGSTATILPQYGVLGGITVESPSQLFVRGSMVRSKFADRTSPLSLRVRRQRPAGLLQPGPGAERRRRHAGRAVRGVLRRRRGQRRARPERDPQRQPPADPAARRCRRRRSRRPAGRRPARWRRCGRWRRSSASPSTTRGRAWRWRSHPTSTICCCRARWRAGRRSPARPRWSTPSLGKGHVVMFAIRPFWRWQTQGTYSLGFNALMHWNDLDAGKTAAATTTARQ